MVSHTNTGTAQFCTPYVNNINWSGGGGGAFVQITPFAILWHRKGGGVTLGWTLDGFPLKYRCDNRALIEGQAG